jgi:hypothetical protein
MLSFEDSAIRVAACFWRAERENEVWKRKNWKSRFAPGSGSIEADEQHDVNLYDVETGKQEALIIRQTPKRYKNGLGNCDPGMKVDTSPWFWSKAAAGC